jgi:hypothetical protein
VYFAIGFSSFFGTHCCTHIANPIPFFGKIRADGGGRARSEGAHISSDKL